MRDIWSFLLQTLTASGTALLLLAVKAVFRDKLSPRWQLAMWGLLALILLHPAGLGGRYVLVNWPLFVEVLKSSLTGEFGTLAQNVAPVPLPALAAPRSVWDWLYLLYAAGVAVLLARYMAAYIRLRLTLRKGRSADMAPIRAAAEKYGLSVCPAVEVEGLSSAFVCGVFRPVLVLPAGEETDEKVLLHELLHLKHRDIVWGLMICLFRCIHWCNPLLWLCADWAGNDLESLCDQRVLERLAGEERREYGKILLSMANERYSRAPGTSSVANGGKNIRRRIEAIARFKRYPAGMGLVSVCIALVIALPLLTGARAETISRDLPFFDQVDSLMASARTTPCTTYAGAFDTYAKAVMTQRIQYRAMCAPLAEQNALAEECRRAMEYTHWDYCDFLGLSCDVLPQSGYSIYNLSPAGENAYEGLLALEMINPPDHPRSEAEPYVWLAVQRVRAEKEGARWVAIPQEAFRYAYAEGWMSMPGGCDALPAWEYAATAGDFTLQIRYQSISQVDSYEQTDNWFGSYSTFSSVPKPDGEFTSQYMQYLSALYTGNPSDKKNYTGIAMAYEPMHSEKPRPVLEGPSLEYNSVGGSNLGSGYGSRPLEPGWKDLIFLGGGGGSLDGFAAPPDGYAVELYLNQEKTAELTLLPVKGSEESYD